MRMNPDSGREKILLRQFSSSERIFLHFKLKITNEKVCGRDANKKNGFGLNSISIKDQLRLSHSNLGQYS